MEMTEYRNMVDVEKVNKVLLNNTLHYQQLFQNGMIEFSEYSIVENVLLRLQRGFDEIQAESIPTKEGDEL